MYCNIVFMIDIFVISKITQYRYYVIAITDVRSLGLSTKWRTLMIKKTMKVRENTFRKLEDPFENGAAKKYVFYVKVDDVAEGIPMATNPRDQKLTSGVATAIKESLLSNDGYFHLKNRGIVLSAESVHYNNKEKIATIIFSDELSHGNIDGGHTYKIVCEHKGENLEQYVQFEVMTGVEDIIENLAEARNTSVQVDAKSMAELAEKFDPIKEGLEGMPFFKRIAFKQNQISVDDETGKKNKMIDAREIVAIIKLKVKELLEERNITQKKLAQISGIRESTISDIVRGTRTVINFEHLSKIAEALEIDNISQLIDFEEI